MEIRIAENNTITRLTEIAFSAKRYWQYPGEYYEIWKDELTITEDYLKNNVVKIIEDEHVIKGFYSFCLNPNERYTGDIFLEEGFWLDHMFLEDKYIGNGYGRCMFNDLIREIKSRAGVCFYIFVDPFAEGFYKKMGCEYLRESKSSIENRNIPVYIYRL